MKISKQVIIGLLLGLAVGLAGGVIIFARAHWEDKENSDNTSQTINSYQECVEAGGRLAETFPEQCYTPDGSKSFTNPDQQSQQAD